MLKLDINGKIHEVDADPDTPLLWVIREWVGLTGTKYGCGIAAGSVSNAKIVTIEGLSDDGLSHPVQAAWLQHEVPQCGYCQSGQIMAAASLLHQKPNPTEADVAQAITNICRCGTYQRIKAAIDTASALSAAAPANGKA
jgi:isoquinoline 1-oxidoreductase alpha subunit